LQTQPISQGTVPNSLDITSIAVSPAKGFAAEVETAFNRALADEGKIGPAVLSMRGISGKKYRRFINNLMEAMSDPRYLEIGAWQGSTLCSAIFENEITATCVDNWSEFDGPFDKFLTNLAKFKGKSRVTFIEKDYRKSISTIWDCSTFSSSMDLIPMRTNSTPSCWPTRRSSRALC
jgi:hypothetical protein